MLDEGSSFSPMALTVVKPSGGRCEFFKYGSSTLSTSGCRIGRSLGSWYGFMRLA